MQLQVSKRRNPKSKAPAKPAHLLSLPATTTVQELKRQLAPVFKVTPLRQRLTVFVTAADGGKVVLKDDRQELGEAVGDRREEKQWEVELKDLGPQIGWRTVYIIEYLGPLFIHAFFYSSFAQTLLYGKTYNHTLVQRAAFFMMESHYLKRELETIFVHRFSASTMPFSYVFRNSFHYWILGGLLIAPFVYRPSSFELPLNAVYLFAGFFTFFELSNAKTHWTLRNLRPVNNPTARGLPTGYGFNFVSCPNYFFESLCWLVLTAMTREWSLGIFWVVGTYTMMGWAAKRHSRYIKEFGKDKVKGRKRMFPFLW
ncbi:trans-2,3-enoyl-CoA reductase [Atractiella rhizophila]|nr:trans-2,3-enoyl-CoA reductase [Atractiella rhizophila]